MTSGYTPLFVGPIKTALERDIDSYLIPEDAFPTLENAYCWRGRVYKKGGAQLLGRLGKRVDIIGTRTSGADTYNTTTVFSPIEPGFLVITDGTTTFTDNGIGGFTITGSSGNTVNAPTNYTTGAFNITFANGNSGKTVTASYLVAVNANSPVMGLNTFDLPNTNQEDLIAFDMLFAYHLNKSSGDFDFISYYKTTGTIVQWTGTNYEFFYSTNYQNAFFVTNGNPGAHFYTITNITQAAAAQVTTSTANNLNVGDLVFFDNVQGMTDINGLTGTVTIVGNPFTVNINSTAFGAYSSGGVVWELTNSTTNGDGIRWMDSTYTWVNFAPPLDQQTKAIPRILQGALMIVPYKGYLIALNTFEGVPGTTATNFPQRARWSSTNPTNTVLSPTFYSSPLPAGNTALPNLNAWVDTLSAAGGAADAATNEEIMACGFIKDTLVVYFQFSTWKLTFTGNLVKPFIWEKINSEIGSSNTFSTIPFDKQVLHIGPYGAYACDSVGMDRIDRIIPDEVFSFQNQNSGNLRIYGIRDYFGEFAFWTYPRVPANSTYTQIFPNRTLVYQYVTQSFSIFKQSFTCFGQYNLINNPTWENTITTWAATTYPWNTFDSQLGFPINVAGNQQGFVFNMQNSDGSPIVGNSGSLVVQAISNATPSIWTSINHNLTQGDAVYIIDVPGSTGLNMMTLFVGENPTSNTFTLVDVNDNAITVASYTYGAYISIVDNMNILSKNLNPYFSQGKSARIGWIDFYFENVSQGLVQVNTYNNDNLNSTEESVEVETQNFNAPNSTLVWIRQHFNTQGAFVQFQITYTNELLLTNNDEAFVLHGMTIWMKPTGRITY